MEPNPAALQAALVKHLQDNGTVTTPAVAAAFRAVPRHLFLPGLPLAEIYADEAIPTKMEDGFAISSSSQPSMMAIMLEQLELAPGQRVLEIGAGTGYNAALMGYLVGAEGRVVTLDIDDDLVAAARAHLAAAGARNVLVLCADGALGHPDLAPYDRIILTVGTWDLAPAWIEQLKPGGRLVAPLALCTSCQKSLALVKAGGAAGPEAPLLTSVAVRDCGFMRMRGSFAGPEQLTNLGPEPGMFINTVTDLPVPAETVYGWVQAGGHDTATGRRVMPSEVWQGLALWLGLHAPQACEFVASGDWAKRSPLPGLMEFDGRRPSRVNLGLLEAEGLSLLWLAPPGALTVDPHTTPRELRARTFGPRGRNVVEKQLLDQVTAWATAGRPGSEGMQVEVYPAGAVPRAGPGEVVVKKAWTTLVVRWEREEG